MECTLGLPTKGSAFAKPPKRPFPCSRCYGAIPRFRGIVPLDLAKGGTASVTRLTGWRNPPLTNRRSDVAVDC